MKKHSLTGHSVWIRQLCNNLAANCGLKNGKIFGKTCLYSPQGLTAYILVVFHTHKMHELFLHPSLPTESFWHVLTITFKPNTSQKEKYLPVGSFVLNFTLNFLEICIHDEFLVSHRSKDIPWTVKFTPIRGGLAASAKKISGIYRNLLFFRSKIKMRNFPSSFLSNW